MVGSLWHCNAGLSILIHDMLNDIYNKKILGFAADIPLLGRLDAPDGTAVAHSKLCGSKVTVDLKLDNGIVTDFAHDVKACALGQASSSIMAHHIVGASTAELRELRDQMHAMLKQDGPAPSGRWADLEALTPVRDFKAHDLEFVRHGRLHDRGANGEPHTR